MYTSLPQQYLQTYSCSTDLSKVGRSVMYVRKWSMIFTALILWNSQLCSGITWKYSVLNFTQTCQEIWKLWVEINLYLQVNYNCHHSNPHDTRASSTTFYGGITIPISMKIWQIVWSLILCHRPDMVCTKGIFFVLCKNTFYSKNIFYLLYTV